VEGASCSGAAPHRRTGRPARAPSAKVRQSVGLRPRAGSREGR
jgi:hypothetical protein